MYEMQIIATDVPVASCLCLSVSLSHACDMQKRLNISRCCLGQTLPGSLRDNVLHNVLNLSPRKGGGGIQCGRRQITLPTNCLSVILLSNVCSSNLRF